MRDCENCARCGRDGCKAWDCDFIPRKEAIRAWKDNADIVRCSECKHCKTKRGTFKGEPIIFYRCPENNRDVESDDYCSWGEREGE